MKTRVPFLDSHDLATALGVTGPRKTLKMPSLKLANTFHLDQIDILEKALTYVLTVDFPDSEDICPIRILRAVSALHPSGRDLYGAASSLLRSFNTALEDHTWVLGRKDFTAWVQENNDIPDADWQGDETLVRQVTALWFSQSLKQMSSMLNG